MTLADRVLALMGWLYDSIRRGAGGSPNAPRVLVIGLLTLSAAPVLIVGSTRQPSDISFEDLRLNRIPAMTSWLRLEGDLRDASEGGEYRYTLHDLRDETLYVTVVSRSPLAIGRRDVTGRLSGARSVGGRSIASIEADVPTEPARHDPWLLFSLPAILAISVVVGGRVGYPVARREASPGSRSGRLGPGEQVSGRWSGRIGSEQVPTDEMIACSVAVTVGPEVCQLTVTDAGSVRTVVVQRASPKARVRLCWVDRSQPALELHAPTADLVLAFAHRTDRDRLAAALE